MRRTQYDRLSQQELGFLLLSASGSGLNVEKRSKKKIYILNIHGYCSWTVDSHNNACREDNNMENASTDAVTQLTSLT